MHRLLLAAALAFPLAGETIEAFGQKFLVPMKKDWEVRNGTLELLVPRPALAPRRPSQYALLDSADYIRVTMEAEVMPEPESLRGRRNSLILVYAWRGPNHFNYAHISIDSAKEAAHHNGIFHVYGGERVRISSIDGPGTLKDREWHKVKLVYDGRTGRVDVWVNGETSPSLRAVDMSLGAGKVGIGSFFDMGTFRNFKVEGETAPRESAQKR